MTTQMNQKQRLLKYGERSIAVEIPGSVSTRELLPRPARPLDDPEAALEAALDCPIGAPRLEDTVRAGERVAVLVPDVTRLWSRTRDYLPSILSRLQCAGIRDSDITLFVACGTHRQNTPEETALIVGAEAAARFRVVQHHPDGPVVSVGTTSRGTPVEIDAAVAEHDRLIMTGGIVHHAMAGYGGGRKSIIPGIASRRAVKANHLWVLDPCKPGIREGVGSAFTDGNPLHEDMVEAAALAKPDFIVNVVTDADGEFAGFYAGHWLEAWQAGCRRVDELYCVPLDRRADVVIGSCGGYPRDISIYQASKAFYNAWMAVKPGGAIVLFVEARDGGGGEEFFRWFNYPSLESCCQALRADFTIAGYMAFLVYCIATQNNVVLVTDLPEDQVRLMHMTPVRPREALNIGSYVKASDDVLLMPEAAITLPRSI
ncbi:MAG: nickel-dependent lactate racemase [Clostridia bacterium]|nr:nickel-dependent lactate racemase [Clostridia bacterium]